ncbi:Phage major capsid protein, P2 family [compost metagenome]
MAAAQAKLYSEATKPTEQIAAQQLAKSIAGRPAYIPPYFPANGMWVTTLANLHIYTQRNTRKRKAADNDDTKGFENQYWRQEGYAIGEYEWSARCSGCFCLKSCAALSIGAPLRPRD